MLLNVVLSSAVLSSVVLRSVVQCVVQCCVCSVLCCVCSVLCCAVLCCAVLCGEVMCCVLLWLCCAVLCCCIIRCCCVALGRAVLFYVMSGVVTKNIYIYIYDSRTSKERTQSFPSSHCIGLHHLTNTHLHQKGRHTSQDQTQNIWNKKRP